MIPFKMGAIAAAIRVATGGGSEALLTTTPTYTLTRNGAYTGSVTDGIKLGTISAHWAGYENTQGDAITLALASEKTITKVRVYYEDTNSGVNIGHPQSLYVKINSSTYTVSDFSGKVSIGAGQFATVYYVDIVVPEQNATSVTFGFAKHATLNWTMISEVEVYGYTPSSLYDPNWASVVLLLHCEGANASTTFTDSSSYNRTMTAAGNAQISTTDPLMGSSSMVLDGTGDLVSAAAAAELGIGLQDFTMEMFVNFTSASGEVAFVSQWGGAATNATRTFIWSHQGSGIRCTVNGSPTVSVTHTRTAGVRSHFAISRQGGTLRFFVDGVKIGSDQAFNHNIATSTTAFRIGVIADASDIPATAFFNGKIDEVRITIGVSRYNGNFVAPTVPFPGAPPPGSAHRYWRLTNITNPGLYVELCELQLFDGTTQRNGTITAQTAPSEAITNLTDGNTGTRAYWPQGTAQNPAFWIQFDFGAGNAYIIDGFKQGGHETSDRYISACTLQYSDDGTNWYIKGSVSGITYPGNGTVGALVPFTGEVTSGLVARLDAKNYSSGQTWVNNVPTPADGSAMNAYDYFLGGDNSATTDDPTINNAGDVTAYWNFDGGDMFTHTLAAASMPALLRNMHKTGQAWTVEIWMQWSGTPAGGIAPMFDSGSSDQSGSDMSRGVLLVDLGDNAVNGQTAGRVRMRVKQDSSGTSAAHAQSDAAIPSAAVQMISISYQANGESFMYRNGNYAQVAAANTFTATLTSPSSTDASNQSRIGACGDGSFKVGNNTRLYQIRIYNRALTKAECDQNWNATKARYGL